MKRNVAIVGLLCSCLICLVAFKLLSGKQQNNVIYAVFPMTGPIAEVGQRMKETIDLFAAEHTNMSFEVVYIDSASWNIPTF